MEWIVEGRDSLARASLKWVLEQEAVTSVIPGFRNIRQVEDNLQALQINNFTNEENKRLSEFYWDEVHSHIRGAY